MIIQPLNMKKLTLTLFALLLTSLSFADSMLIESFEYANHDSEIPIGWTCDDQSWLCGYQEKDHNRLPHTGNWYAFTNAEESWMFMPLYFSSQLKYRLSCWSISDGEYDLEFWLGHEADASQMAHQICSFNISGGEFEKVAIYVESLSSNYDFFGIRAIAHEGAAYLTIDDINVDMVAKYEFISNPSSADTVLFPGSQATHHFSVHNLGYLPIDVILSPSHEYFNNIHFTVNGNPCNTFHLEPDEEKQVIAEATLLPSIPIGSTCWLDIMLLLDCDCATSMTTLWVTVVSPTETDEHSTGITAFPNPADNYININVKGLRQVVVTDLYGKNVITMATDHDDYRLDVSQLKPGIYFVTTTTDQGSTTQKIVKK